MKDDKQVSINRKILFFSDVNDTAIKKLIEDVMSLDNGTKEPIHIYINSYGGYVDCMQAVIDVLSLTACPIYTYITGAACSAACCIALVGEQRFITKNSQIMQHRQWGICSGYLQEAENEIKHFKAMEHTINKWCCKRIGMKLKDFEKLIKDELWMDANQALKLGFVHKIL